MHHGHAVSVQAHPVASMLAQPADKKARLYADISLLSWAQMVALLYYTLSYFPGGMVGVRFVLQLASGACMQCFLGARAAVFR